MSEAGFDENGLAVERPPQQRRSEPVVTFAIIAINAIVYLAMCVKGVSFMHPTAQDVIPWGASYGPLTLGGQWWRLLTEIFVHFGIVHIGVNMYILYQVGVLTEILFGKVRYAVLYLVAGLAGSLTSLYVHPLGVSAGASGAIFGVFGALLAFLLIERGVIPAKAALQIARSLAIFLGYNLIYGLASKTTDLSAHVGGLVTGFVVGCLLLLRPWTRAPERMPLIQIVTVIAVTCALAAVGSRFVPKTERGNNDWTRQLMIGATVPAPNQGRVIYSGSATKDDAAKLMKGLAAENFFARPGAAVLLSKGPSGTSISVPVGPDEKTFLKVHPPLPDDVNAKPGEKPNVPAPVFPWNDPQVTAAFTETGVDVAPLVGGPPIKMLLLTDLGDVKRTIWIDMHQATIGGRDKVWYSGAATAKDAAALGEALQSYGLFRDDGARVMLAKGPAGTELSFTVGNQAWGNPKLAAGFAALAQRLAGSVGGLPIRVHLLDSTLRVRETLVVK
ncbi:MAG TPA: rhomboid family intramembrane serine protease [Acidobacteriaceae bacterium]|nr:rhomboid family intramembrane serine protease [Acidobacteriaceae bacterium]